MKQIEIDGEYFENYAAIYRKDMIYLTAIFIANKVIGSLTKSHHPMNEKFETGGIVPDCQCGDVVSIPYCKDPIVNEKFI